MTVEMRGIKTNLGALLPYFKVPYSKNQISAEIGGYRGALANFGQTITAKLLPSPMLEDFRNIWKETCLGGNPGAYLGTRAGIHRLLRNDLASDAMTMTISPGTLNWVEGASGFTTVKQTGSFTDNAPGAWTESSTNYPVQISPIPADGMVVPYSDRPDRPYTYVLTTDRKLWRVSFFIDVNINGWMFLVIDAIYDTPLGTKDVEATYQTEFIKMLGSDNQEDPMARYNPRIATSNVGAYVLTKENVRDFLKNLWTTDVIDSIRQTLVGDGSNAVLGLQWFYGLADKINTAGTPSKINVGNVSFNSVTSVPVATDEFVEFDFGSVAVPRVFGDYHDFSAIAYRAYLPFVGAIDLDPRDVVGATLYLKYRINITDGSAVAQLSTSPNSPDSSGLIFSTSCVWGYDIPIRVDPGRSPLLATLRTLGASQYFDGSTPSYSAGSLTPNTSVAGDFEAKLILYRRDEITNPAAVQTAVGKPSAASLTVGEATGYLKAHVVYNASSLPTRHAGEIIGLLQEGIYI